MPAPVSSSRLTFNQGILESQEGTKVPIGFLKSCVNWVPEPSGGLRARAGWSLGSVTGLPATRRCLGIGMFQRYVKPLVVQKSTVFVTSWATATAQTPTLTWPQATQNGNLLLCLIGFGKSDAAGSMTLTPSAGWTTRSNITSTGQQQFGVLEQVNATSQSGDVTPFTLTSTNGSGQNIMHVWLIEVSGINSSSAFDLSATASGTATSASMTTGAISQSSEFVIACDVIRNVGFATALTLSSATANWTEADESGYTPGSYDYVDAAFYTGARTAVGAQSIAIASSASAAHAGVLLTYRGFYSGTGPPTVDTLWLTALDNTSTYDIYAADRSTLGSATFSAVDSGVGDSTNVDPVAFTMGFSKAWYTSPTFASVRSFDGTNAVAVAGSPAGGRSIAVHRSRLWVGGSSALPARLYFSQVSDGTTWTGTGTGYFDFGRDDGETIEDITPFADGLVIGKRTSVHFLAGSNTDTFSPTQLPAGGAAPGRSVLSTPYGCVIAGREMVYLFDGSTVTPIGRAIESSYSIADGEFVSTSYIDGSVYIAHGASQRIFVFDINAGVWRIEQIGNTLAESAGVLYNYGSTQLYGPVAAAVGGALNYRTFPAPTRSRDFTGIPQVFSAQTGHIPFGGPRRPITVQGLYAQVRQRNGVDTDTGLTVTPVYDRVDGTDCLVRATDPGVRRLAVNGFPQQKAGSAFVGVKFSQTSPSGESAIFDIEDTYLDYIVEQARPVQS